jgi:alkanesulfonate monooxygenase SsuD/methylene tetrahydromethanopterin reductase-like flavin-dependent oxidoreductase (luciferase family)
LLGGSGPHVFDRVVQYGDVWGPVVPDHHQDGGVFAEKVTALRAKAAAAGRDPGSITVTMFNARPEPDVIERMEAAGVQRMVFGVPVAGRDLVEPHLDRLATLIAGFPPGA